MNHQPCRKRQWFFSENDKTWESTLSNVPLESLEETDCHSEDTINKKCTL
jgi:hypothetical protein